jgi:hypothetical protein
VTAPSPADLLEIDPFRRMLPAEGGMRAPGLLFANRALLEKMFSYKTPSKSKTPPTCPASSPACCAGAQAGW